MHPLFATRLNLWNTIPEGPSLAELQNMYSQFLNMVSIGIHSIVNSSDQFRLQIHDSIYLDFDNRSHSRNIGEAHQTAVALETMEEDESVSRSRDVTSIQSAATRSKPDNLGRRGLH